MYLLDEYLVDSEAKVSYLKWLILLVVVDKKTSSAVLSILIKLETVFDDACVRATAHGFTLELV